MTDRRPSRDSPESARPKSSGGFRWTCPICGRSRLNSSEGESGMANAIAAIQTHVVATDGAGHGPKNEFPPELDRATLSDHVVRVDGR